MSKFETLLGKYKHAIIISANSPKNDESDAYALHETLKLTSKGRFMPVQGCYKGETEDSYIIFSDDVSQMLSFQQLALGALNQECVLFLDGAHRKAVLQYDGHWEVVGTELVRYATTRGLDNYTMVDGEIWAVA